MRREYTSAVGEYRTVSGKVTGPWRRGMCPRRRWREKCARARSRHRPRPRAVECRGYSKELWSQQKAYLPPRAVHLSIGSERSQKWNVLTAADLFDSYFSYRSYGAAVSSDLELRVS